MVLDWLANLSAHYPLVFFSIIGVLSLLVLLQAANILIYGITRFAQKLGISDYLIGFLVVGIGTSIPEFVSGVMGQRFGEGGIVLGTILGSAVCTLSLLLGVLAIVGKKLNVDVPMFTGKKWLMPLGLFVPFMLSVDGVLSRLDGVILLFLYLGYASFLWKKEGEVGKLKKKVAIKHVWRDAAIFLGCLVALLLSARWLVFSTIQISKHMEILPYFIAVTIIALGNSLPDMIVEVRSLRRGHQQLGFGNVLGGVISELLLFLGILVIYKPITLSLSVTWPAFLFAFILMGILLYSTRKNGLTRSTGLVLVGVYALFLIVQTIL